MNFLVDGALVCFSFDEKNGLNAQRAGDERIIPLRGLSEERSRLTEKTVAAYVKSLSLRWKCGELQLSHPLRAGGCASSKSTVKKNSQVEDCLRLSEAEERKGNLQGAIAYCTRALGFAESAQVAEIQERIQRLKGGEISPPRRQSSFESSQFHSLFGKLMKKLNENQTEKAKTLCQKLSAQDPNSIKNISHYYNELFTLLGDEPRFRAIDGDNVYRLKEELLLLLKNMTLSHCSRAREQGMAIEHNEAEAKKGILTRHTKWILSSEKQLPFSDFYYEIEYITELLALLPDTVGLVQRLNLWSRLSQIAEDLFSLSFVSAGLHTLQALGAEGLRAIGKSIRTSKNQKTVDTLLHLQVLCLGAIQKGEWSSFHETMSALISGSTANWKVYYKMVGDWAKVAEAFLHTPQALQMVVGDRQRIGLISFTTFSKLRGESWRIREKAFQALIALWNTAPPAIKAEIQSVFRAGLSIQRDPHLQRLLQSEEAARIRLGESLPQANQKAAQRVEDYTKELSERLSELAKKPSAEKSTREQSEEDELNRSFEEVAIAIVHDPLPEIRAEQYAAQGDRAYARGNYRQAIELYRQDVAEKERQYGNQSREASNAYHRYGRALDGQGHYDQALNFYEKALQIRRRVLGENHLDVGSSYNNAGILYEKKKQNEKALEYYGKSLEINLKILGENHSLVAISYTCLGLFYKRLGQYEKAREYYNKALEIKLKIFEENHASVATAYNNIGSLCEAQGKYQEASKYLEKALEIRLKVLHPNHPEIAASYNNLGVVYYRKHHYTKALQYCQKGLEIRNEVLGPNHPSTKSSQETVSVILEAMPLS